MPPGRHWVTNPVSLGARYVAGGLIVMVRRRRGKLWRRVQVAILVQCKLLFLADNNADLAAYLQHS